MSSCTGSSRAEAGSSRTAASWATVNRRPIDAATAAALRAAGDMRARRRRMLSRTRRGSRASISVARPASKLTRCSSRRPESSSMRRNGFPRIPSARASRESSGAAPRTSAIISATAVWSRRPRTVWSAPFRSSSATAAQRLRHGRVRSIDLTRSHDRHAVGPAITRHRRLPHGTIAPLRHGHTGDGTGRSRPGASARRLRGADPAAGGKISHRAEYLADRLRRRCGGQVKAHGGQLRPAGDAELREDVVKMAGHGAM